ncbi:MAG: ribosome maturation factor RimM [Acholeplasmataceae bacterium]|jgi:16S rRNA processing protein RimM|nr:ribosome maturation factor RimM [Acholeplasmataceae bacterium]
MYQIGKITNTHGIKGEVKIYNLSDFNRFFIGNEIYTMIKGVKKTFTIERVRPQGTVLIVKFKDFNDINEILPYKGEFLYSDEKPDLDEDDYHYDDLLEKEVFNESGERLGKVTSLIPVPQGHLLEIEKLNGKKALIPFVDEFVIEIEEDKIIIRPIEGLL